MFIYGVVHYSSPAYCLSFTQSQSEATKDLETTLMKILKIPQKVVSTFWTRKFPVLCCLPLGKLKGPTFEEKVFATLKTSQECDRSHLNQNICNGKNIYKDALYAHQGEHVYQTNIQ